MKKHNKCISSQTTLKLLIYPEVGCFKQETKTTFPHVVVVGHYGQDLAKLTMVLGHAKLYLTPLNPLFILPLVRPAKSPLGPKRPFDAAEG